MAMGHAAAAHARSHVPTTPRPDHAQTPDENDTREQAPIESVERHARQESGGSAPTPALPVDEQAQTEACNAPETQGQSADPESDAESFSELLKPPVQSMPVRVCSRTLPPVTKASVR